ncbi:E3 ubiquitin protein ligase [Tolypothrix sp. FACHB-123]|nr:E3 ubiquitin protein ligase [Tolypothrix sp. FACHB-123]
MDFSQRLQEMWNQLEEILNHQFEECLDRLYDEMWNQYDAMDDADYSQEALEGIFTNLIVPNPRSNAAPPASEQALQSLRREKFTKKLLEEGDNGECIICIDRFEETETVIALPCKHWFHDACVTMWLERHNTCPLCREPIEAKKQGDASSCANGDSGDSGGSGNSSRSKTVVDSGTILARIDQKCRRPGSRTALVGLGGVGYVIPTQTNPILTTSVNRSSPLNTFTASENDPLRHGSSGSTPATLHGSSRVFETLLAVLRSMVGKIRKPTYSSWYTTGYTIR